MSQDDLRAIEYHAAKRIWRKRLMMTPSGETTWEDWYLRRFGRTLDEAAVDFGANGL